MKTLKTMKASGIISEHPGSQAKTTVFNKLPPVKRVALLYGQRPLNKGSTKVLMFPFAIRAKHGVLKANNQGMPGNCESHT